MGMISMPATLLLPNFEVLVRDDAPLAKHLPTRTTSRSLNQSTPLSNLDYLPQTSPRMNPVHLLLRPCQPSLKRFRTSYPVKYSSLKPLNLNLLSLKMKPTTLPKLQNSVPKYPREYHDFFDIFRAKAGTETLPPAPRLRHAHRPYSFGKTRPGKALSAHRGRATNLTRDT